MWSPKSFGGLSNVSQISSKVFRWFPNSDLDFCRCFFSGFPHGFSSSQLVSQVVCQVVYQVSQVAPKVYQIMLSGGFRSVRMLSKRFLNCLPDGFSKRAGGFLSAQVVS